MFSLSEMNEGNLLLNILVKSPKKCFIYVPLTAIMCLFNVIISSLFTITPLTDLIILPPLQYPFFETS